MRIMGKGTNATRAVFVRLPAVESWCPPRARFEWHIGMRRMTLCPRSEALEDTESDLNDKASGGKKGKLPWVIPAGVSAEYAAKI